MTNGRAILLPPHIEPIVYALDSIAHMRHMGMLFEANVCGGTLMASGIGAF
jgi:TRAP-type C4-dicarboxylate transport system permease large subunit